MIMKIKAKDFLLLPNMLSMLRIFSAVPCFLILKQPTLPLIPFLIFSFIIISTDILDGYFARRLNQITELGKILDPLADKLILILVSIALFISSRIPLSLLILFISKDLIIMAGGVIIARHIHKVSPSNIFGKLASFALAVGFFIFILFPEIIIGYLLISTGILFVFLSLGSYGLIFAEFVFKKKNFHVKLAIMTFMGLLSIIFIVYFYIPYAGQIIKLVK